MWNPLMMHGSGWINNVHPERLVWESRKGFRPTGQQRKFQVRIGGRVQQHAVGFLVPNIPASHRLAFTTTTRATATTTAGLQHRNHKGSLFVQRSSWATTMPTPGWNQDTILGGSLSLGEGAREDANLHLASWTTTLGLQKPFACRRFFTTMNDSATSTTSCGSNKSNSSNNNSTLQRIPVLLVPPTGRFQDRNSSSSSSFSFIILPKRVFSKLSDGSSNNDHENNDEKNPEESKKSSAFVSELDTSMPPFPREKLSLSRPITPSHGIPKSSVMDRDFQRYLIGEMKPPVPDPITATNNNSTAAQQQQQQRRRKRPSRLPDPDKDLYARIQKQQLLKKEESRLKTAQNVYRALLGNVIICAAKFGAWASSGSSGMLAEFIHSVVDCGNQALLLVGLRNARLSPDRAHPYGYGKSVYFWALVSALGTFFLGAGVSMTHAIGEVMNPSLHEITWHVWGVLLFSLAVDGYVLGKTIAEVRETKPEGVTLYKHVSNMRDPATLAVLLEDVAACLGVLLALGGITATHVTGNPIFDGLAGVGISALLGGMGIILARVNHRFLLGQAVDKEIVDDINKILLSRRSIDSIGSVQSQWTGPETFSYKAEVDFDGTYLAATLMRFYQQEFLKIRDSMDDELQVLLAFYSEDVMRTVERQIRKSEALIREKYPGAEYIELEPMSVDVDRLAIDDNLEAELRRVEEEALDRFLKHLRAESSPPNSGAQEEGTTTTTFGSDVEIRPESPDSSREKP